VVEARKLPRDFAVTPTFQILRACERFGGVDPLKWWESLSAGTQALVLAYSGIRERMESRQ
jgi:hypothetical protein